MKCKWDTTLQISIKLTNMVLQVSKTLTVNEEVNSDVLLAKQW